MKFVKTEDLKVGMRVAKPIYNRLGVLLYDRESTLTPQAVSSVENFGLIGLYILEPAEPAPPITPEEIEFERFQTIYIFRLKEIMDSLRAGKASKDIYTLSETIIQEYGSLDHRFPFSQNLRSKEDYHYKHCLNVAILCAMICKQLKVNHEDTLGVVSAALLHDIGLLDMPEYILAKTDDDLTDEDVELLTKHLQQSYHMLQPATNLFDLPKETLSIIVQTNKAYYHPKYPKDRNARFTMNARILQVANEYDTKTAMRLTTPPMSDINAFRFLHDHPTYYDERVVKALTDSIYIVPRGCSVELSNGQKAMVIEANASNFMEPVVLQFSDNRMIDLSNRRSAGGIYITDIMKTMDNRIHIDEDTLKQFTVDAHLSAQLNKLRSKKTSARLVGNPAKPAAASVVKAGSAEATAATTPTATEAPPKPKKKKPKLL
ncbi:MAG: HD domain-containing protein [Lachnospiraceae bacterium]|jgi:HD superfamily phosphodiesterase|nr:HD domain-containing protein [Lachnospiraceae bacterium]